MRFAKGAQPRGVALIAAAGLLAAVAGCRDEELRFSHRAHIGRGLACEACHDPGAPTIRAGHGACTRCHQIGEGPQKQCRYCHASSEGEERASAAAVSGADIVFSHARHRRRGIDCVRCHAGIEKAQRFEPGAHLPSMESCLECHRAHGPAATRCSLCHERISRATRPASHGRRWLSRHGQASRAPQARCAACHAEAACVRCHQEMPPRDHGEFWLRRGHGLKSRWDRERCQACHREDACVECHRTTPPTNHGPGWVEPTFRHCRMCHYPLSDTACAVCHSRAHPRGVPFRR